MSRIKKADVQMIARAIKSGPGRFKLNTGWKRLCSEFDIGSIDGSHVVFSREDLKIWRELLFSSLGFDPLVVQPEGGRISVSKITADEKWAGEPIQKRMVSLTVINGELILTGSRSPIIEDVEYRVDWRRIDISGYQAIVVIENLAAFLSIHRFKLPEFDNVLVLYRGHDQSARAVMDLLISNSGALPVYFFTDSDPSGIGIIIDSPYVTHAICPDVKDLQQKDSVRVRFEKQIGYRPNILTGARNCTKPFYQYASHIVNNGIAISQEWLCSHNIPLLSIHLRER